MSASAKAGGAMLLEAERALDAAFRSNHVDGTVLRQLLNRAENARRELRRVHLSAHLGTKPILNPQQRERYAKLRGYEPHSKH